MTKRKEIRGVVPPMLTPLDTNGDIDADALKALGERLISAGVDAIFLAGTAGFGAELTNSRYADLVEKARLYFGQRIPLVAGVIETSTQRAIERLRILEQNEYKYFVLTTTYYLPARGAKEQLTHFGRCAESSDMEMIVYNIPGCVGVNIEVETIMTMAKKGWTRTVKDSSGSEGYFTRLCEAAREYGVNVFQGLRPDTRKLVELKAAGCVPVPGNVRPDLFVKAWRAALNRDYEATARLQEQIDRLWRVLVLPDDFFSGSSRALAREGIAREILPEPLPYADPARHAEIDNVLKEIP